jgi:hypothetical protein
MGRQWRRRGLWRAGRRRGGGLVVRGFRPKGERCFVVGKGMGGFYLP